MFVMLNEVESCLNSCPVQSQIKMAGDTPALQFVIPSEVEESLINGI